LNEREDDDDNEEDVFSPRIRMRLLTHGIRRPFGMASTANISCWPIKEASDEWALGDGGGGGGDGGGGGGCCGEEDGTRMEEEEADEEEEEVEERVVRGDEV